jgi:hypothetical protein
MNVGAFGFIVFFVSLNVAIYLISQTQVLPYQQSPYATPSTIQANLLHLDLSASNLMIGGTTLSVLIILGFITGHLLFGGTVAIIIFAMDLLFPVLKWVILGVPSYMAEMGVPPVIVAVVTALMSAVWLWFLLGFVAQRPLEQ